MQNLSSFFKGQSPSRRAQSAVELGKTCRWEIQTTQALYNLIMVIDLKLTIFSNGMQDHKTHAIGRNASAFPVPLATSSSSGSSAPVKMGSMRVFRSDEFSDSKDETSFSSPLEDSSSESSATNWNRKVATRNRRSVSQSSTSNTDSDAVPTSSLPVFTSKDNEESELESHTESEYECNTTEEEEAAELTTQASQAEKELDSDVSETETPEEENEEESGDIAAAPQIRVEISPLKANSHFDSLSQIEPRQPNYGEIIHRGFSTLASTRGQKRKRPTPGREETPTKVVSKKPRPYPTPGQSSPPDLSDQPGNSASHSPNPVKSMDRFLSRKPSSSGQVNGEGSSKKRLLGRSASLPRSKPSSIPANTSAPVRKASTTPKTPRTQVDTSKRTVKSAMRNSANNRKEDQGTTGRFTENEKCKLDDFKDQFCENHGMSKSTFNAMVQHSMRDGTTWPGDDIISKTEFWDEFYDVLPYRKRYTIWRFAQRRYIDVGVVPYKWTPEQDDELAAMVREYGTKWKTIGVALGRNQEDCSARWYNYLEHRDKSYEAQWSEDELKLLVQKIVEAKTAIGVAHDTNTDRLIQWSQISNLMGNIRTRQQCSNKWRRLRKLERDRKNRLEKRDLQTVTSSSDPTNGGSIMDWVIKQEASLKSRNGKRVARKDRRKTKVPRRSYGAVSDEQVIEVSDDHDSPVEEAEQTDSGGIASSQPRSTRGTDNVTADLGHGSATA